VHPAESKKRSRSPPLFDKKVKKEAIKVEEDDEDEDIIVKRPRRAEKTEVEEDDEPAPPKPNAEPKPKSKPEPSLKKSKSIAPPPKKVKKEFKKGVKKEIEDEEDESDGGVAGSSSSNAKLKRRDSNSSASVSEIEEGLEEEDEGDEDEKPELAAKAREKVQTTLKAKTKDPYPDWKPGTPVPYAALCTTFSLIEMTTKRLVIAAHCSLFLRQVLRLTPDDLLPTVLLMINKLAADYAGIELGIGESLIMKAIGESTGRSLQVIKQDQKEIGDLGLVAVKSRANQPTMFKPKPLTVRAVHKGLMDVATTSGSGAQGRKVDLIKKLLSAADGHSAGKVDITKDKGGPSEAKYLVRFLEGKLRLGLAERTVLVSLAQAMVCHELEAKGSGKVPSTEQLATGEAMLKLVHR
jgi:DNA ligase 1